MSNQAFEDRRIAVKGMSWMTFQNIGVRAITFAGQLILGWLLIPEEFGLYALALSVANAVGALRNGGIGQLLLRKTTNFEKDLGALTEYALLFNLLAATVTCAVAPLAARYFGSRQLGWLLIWIALSFPTGTVAVVFRSRLTVDGRYRELSVMNIASNVLWQASTIVMALAHCGAYSYVIPTAAQGLFETLIGYLYVRQWPLWGRHLTIKDIRRFFVDTRWVMLGAAMLSLATTGNYFAVGLFAHARLVGLFFFASQLIASIANVLQSSIENVLPPLFAKLNDRPDRQNETVADTLSLFMLMCWPLAGFISVAAPLAIQVMWAGKWDAAAGALSSMAYCLPAWAMVGVVRSLLEARGLWRERFLLLGAYGIGAAIVAAAASAQGLSFLSGAVTCFYMLLAIASVIVLCRLTGHHVGQLLYVAVFPGLLTWICGYASNPLVTVVAPHVGATSRAILSIALCSSAILLINASLLSGRWRDAKLKWTGATMAAPVLPLQQPGRAISTD